MKEKIKSILHKWWTVPPSGLVDALHALKRQMAKEVLDEFHVWLVTKDYGWTKDEKSWKSMDVYTNWLAQQEEE